MHFHGNARFFLRGVYPEGDARRAQDRLRFLRMTAATGFSAACKGPPFQTHSEKSALQVTPAMFVDVLLRFTVDRALP